MRVVGTDLLPLPVTAIPIGDTIIVFADAYRRQCGYGDDLVAKWVVGVVTPRRQSD